LPQPTRRFHKRLATGLLAAQLAFSALLAPAGAQAQVQSPVQSPVRLPALGESASDDLSVANEKRMGDSIMREARRDPQFLDDPVLLAYLQQLWNPLVAAAKARGDINAETENSFAWEAFLVRDRSVNAFALPGGYVGIHLGLIALTTTSDQLASVLAHELSHVTQRHIARSIAPQQRASIVAIASFLLGIIAASRTNNIDAANAAIMGGQGAAIQAQLNFSRDMEREADRNGFGILQQAGYSPTGMAAMFEKMDGAMRLNDNGGFPYLRTHPLTTDRITEARNRALLDGRSAPPPTLLHAVMQARARVLMDDSAQAMARLSGGTSSPLLADRVSALYGGALAASLLRDHDRAARQAQETLKEARSAAVRDAEAERAIVLLQAQVALDRGAPGAALQVLDTLAPRNDRPALLMRAQAVLALDRQSPGTQATALRDSTEALQTWVSEHPQDPLAWADLAATSSTLGLKLRAMRASAEAQLSLGDLQGAIDRMRAAQAASRGATGPDFIEASVIDARLRQMVTQRRLLQLEARESRGGRGGPDRPEGSEDADRPSR
jgi:predicted Zn-dependent protease